MKMLLTLLLLLLTSLSWGRPFAEYEPTRYLALSWNNTSMVEGQGQVVREIIKHVPLETEIIFLIERAEQISSATEEIKELTKNNFHFIVDNLKERRIGVWLRDSLPYPLVEENTGALESVSDQKYRNEGAGGWEPDLLFSRFLDVPLTKNPLRENFEHGNLLTDRKGRCFTIRSKQSEAFFRRSLGCREIFFFERRGGIGHIDERIKIVSDEAVLTDTPEYVSQLEGLGFHVTLVPRPTRPMVTLGQFSESRTYMNSIIVGKTILVPVYREAAYESVGLKAVGIDSRLLSDQGSGSLHCISMNFP